MIDRDAPDTDQPGRSVLQRLEILDAFIVAFDRRDELMQIVASAMDADDARRRLGLSFGFSDVQAHAALDLQVRRFAGRQRQIIIEEREELRAQIASD